MSESNECLAPQPPTDHDRSHSAADSDTPAWHAGFLQLLPAIEQHARIAFRRLKREAREEAVQEVVANTMVAYVRLVEIGKTEVAFATPLANFAIAQFYDGRRVGSTLNVRDITSPYCQKQKGVVVERLDQWDKEEGCWQEVLVEDRTCTPAELAASRIDFAAWLQALAPRERSLALTLGAGERTQEAAERYQLSPARISQMRRELYGAWVAFHEGVQEPAGENATA